jgi:hypothetical protein
MNMFEIILYLVFVGKIKLYINTLYVVLGLLLVKFLIDHQYIDNYIDGEHKFDYWIH